METSIKDTSLTNSFALFFEYDKEIESLCYTNKVTLLRIFQEQLSNVIKYSHATFFKATVKIVGREAVLTMEDNGIGFDTNQHKNGIGILNITRRARLCNGEAEIISSPGNGCRLVAKIPAGKKRK